MVRMGTCVTWSQCHQAHCSQTRLFHPPFCKGKMEPQLEWSTLQSMALTLTLILNLHWLVIRVLLSIFSPTTGVKRANNSFKISWFVVGKWSFFVCYQKMVLCIDGLIDELSD